MDCEVNTDVRTFLISHKSWTVADTQKHERPTNITFPSEG